MTLLDEIQYATFVLQSVQKTGGNARKKCNGRRMTRAVRSITLKIWFGVDLTSCEPCSDLVPLFSYTANLCDITISLPVQFLLMAAPCTSWLDYIYMILHCITFIQGHKFYGTCKLEWKKEKSHAVIVLCIAYWYHRSTGDKMLTYTSTAHANNIDVLYVQWSLQQDTTTGHYNRTLQQVTTTGHYNRTLQQVTTTGH
jgi:hypothetical protein